MLMQGENYAKESQQRLSDLQAKLLRINDKKIEIERQREKLHLEALSLLRQYSPIEKDFLAESEMYSQVWGQKFGKHLQQKLPRELRDIIYGFLVESPDSIAIKSKADAGPWYEFGNASIESIKYENRVAEIAKLHQPFVSPDFLGEAVSCEVVQTFYERNMFRINDMEELEEFFTQDIFGGSVKPKDFIRKLKVRFDESILVNGWNWDATSSTAAVPTNGVGEEITPQPLPHCKVTHLDKLALIKNKQGFEIEIDIRAGKRYVLHPLLVNLGSIVYKLKDMGFKVRVTQKHKKKVKKYTRVTEQKAYAWPESDWTFLFERSKREWDCAVKSMTLHDDQPEKPDPWGDWGTW